MAAHGAALLLIDDDEPFRTTLARFLRNHGYTAHAVGNTEDGFCYLRANPTVRLVVLDLRMAERSGVDFLQQREQDDELREVPVVVLSGAPNAGTLVGTYSVQEVLSKPAAPETLLELAARYCGSAPAGDP